MRGIGIAPVSWKQFGKDLKREVKDDNVSNGAAALAYYLMLSIFPAAIALLSVLPYLPIPNLQQALTDMVNQALPAEASGLFTNVVQQVTSQRSGGLLSFGLLATIWAASNGLYAVMQQLNITYDVKEGRPFWKARGTALLLTVFFSVLIISAFGLIVFGGVLQSWLTNVIGFGPVVAFFFAALRWVIIASLLLLAFAITYYFGPDVDQKFRFVSPGAVLGVLLLAGASLLFRLYVANFSSYSATYGSLGAVIILLLWLYITGLVILLGSEINALVEHYRPEGKEKGQKAEGQPKEGQAREQLPRAGRDFPVGKRGEPERPPTRH